MENKKNFKKEEKFLIFCYFKQRPVYNVIKT